MARKTSVFLHPAAAATVIVGLSGTVQLYAVDEQVPSSTAPAVRTNQVPPPYELEFSTYFGGSNFESVRGMCADAQGNIYITGGTSSKDFPTTPGACCTKYENGFSKVIVAKFSPAGRLIWSTLLGGEGHDRAYTIKVDRQGYVYVSGRASPGFPTTPGSFQPDFRGWDDHGAYGPQNGFVAKLTPDGSKILWASFAGTGSECRDMDLDDEGNIYLTLPYHARSTFTLPDAWFGNAVQKVPRGSDDCGLIKVSNDGSRVLWATWVGGTKGNFQDASLCVGRDRCPVFFSGTCSKDMPVTPGAFRQTPGASWLGKLSADGSRLIFGTYVGDNVAIPRTHAVQEDRQGDIFLAVNAAAWPATPGAYQARYAGGKSDFVIAKVSPSGALLAATYLGGSGSEFNGPDTICLDDRGYVLIVGYTNSADYPVTAGAFHGKCGGQFDGCVSLLSNDLSTLLYSSYMGGRNNDNLRAACFGPGGALYVAGASDSPDWPTNNPWQPRCTAVIHAPGIQDWGSGNIVIAKFVPAVNKARR